MPIKVWYHASFSDLTGREEETILSDGLTLDDLFYTLITKYGEQFKQLLLDSQRKEISPAVVVLVNSLLVSRNAHLKDGDEIAFLMPLAGG